MPLPLVIPPVAYTLVKIGAAAAAGAALAARGRHGPERIDVQSENALDRLPPGVDVRLDRANGRVDTDVRVARAVRFGPGGPGFAFEIAGIGRLRLRRLKARG
ncbi:MAG: hypothetical protein EA355_12655 [Rhodobacteraceae bacterium]|nr:MAG: hypothetical protein EA355_12655 [Paracoccaceae bacterium]